MAARTGLRGWPVLLLLVGGVSLLLAAGLFLLNREDRVGGGLAPLIERYGGSPAIGGPFRLVGMDGEAVTEATSPETITLIFFGFTHCPDFCPTALLKVGQALDRLSPEEVARVRPLFISLDPERDTPEILRDYVSLFHPAIVGATADPATLAEVAKLYRAYYAKVELEGGGYTVDHSTFLYLVNAEGRNLGLFNHGTEVERLSEALSAFLGALAANGGG